METIKVVALVGQAGSGKSEVAQHLVANHGFTLVKFTGILKDMCRVLGLTERELEGDLKESPSSLLLGQTPRYAMQTLGTEWGRDILHPDLWSHVWKIKALRMLEEGKKIVADDCRFLNEAKFIRSPHPSQIWRIKRKDLPPPMEHQSETEMDMIHVDRTLHNTTTLGALKTAVDGMILYPKGK